MKMSDARVPRLDRIDPAVSDLRISVMRLSRRLRSERLPGDLTLGAMAALAQLERYGPATTSELAANERITPQSMTRTVTELVDRGLVERTPDPTDGRQTLLLVTPAGAEFVARSSEQRDAWLTRALANLTEAERGLLLVAGPLLDRLASLPSDDDGAAAGNA